MPEDPELLLSQTSIKAVSINIWAHASQSYMILANAKGGESRKLLLEPSYLGEGNNRYHLGKYNLADWFLTYNKSDRIVHRYVFFFFVFSFLMICVFMPWKLHHIFRRTLPCPRPPPKLFFLLLLFYIYIFILLWFDTFFFFLSICSPWSLCM